MANHRKPTIASKLRRRARKLRRPAVTLAAGTLAGAILTAAGTGHAATAPHPRPAVCARQAPRGQHWPAPARIGDSGLSYYYVTRDEARYFHISRCSVVISGNGQSVIVAPSGRVVTTS